jgi:colanic acid/amylovoran biosynthesis protein
MEALLINVHSTRNAGDAALTACAIRQLQHNFPGVRVSLAIDDLGGYQGEGQAIPSLFTWLKRTGADGQVSWNRLRLLLLLPATLLPLLGRRLFGKRALALAPTPLRPLLRVYAQAGLVASAPGGFLYSSGQGLTLLVALYTMFLALAAGKPLYLFPQSYGPFFHGWERRAVRWVLDKARLVLVREEVSLDELQQCGLPPERLRLIPDIALAYPPAPADEARNWLLEQGIDPEGEQPLLGVTMINWEAQNTRFQRQKDYEAAVCAAARYFVEECQGRVLLLPQVTGPFPSQDDRVPAQRVASRLEDLREAVVLIRAALPAGLLKAVYGQLDLLVGSRMHSNIFAVGMGVPVIPIGYQHKTRGIARTLGIEAWVLDIQELDERAVVNKLKELWSRRAEVRKSLQETLLALEREAQMAGVLMAEDYHQLRRPGTGN